MNLEQIIIEEELNAERTRAYFALALERGRLIKGGTEFARIIPPVGFFRPDNLREIIKNRVFEKLSKLFEETKKCSCCEEYYPLEGMETEDTCISCFEAEARG